MILVDDGLATGATMEAAILALLPQLPARIVVAAPVGARATCERLRRLADEVVCVAMPEPFQAVGLWYDEFQQTSDDEVKRLLSAAGTGNPTGGSARPSSPVAVLRERAQRLKGDPSQYDALLEGSAMRASSCWAKPRTGRMSSTASAPSSPGA